MKKATVIALAALFFISIKFSFSQVGINTSTPHSSAALDIQATNKGVLIPQVCLTSALDVSTIANPQSGLLVFNTGGCGLTNRGFYYFEGGRWLEIINNNRTFVAASYAELFTYNSFGSAPTTTINSTSWTTFLDLLPGPHNDESMATYDGNGGLVVNAGYEGLYSIDVSISLQGDNNNQIIGTVWVNGVRQETITFHAKLQSNGDLRSCSASGIIDIPAGMPVTLQFKSVSGPANIKVDVCNIRIQKIGAFSGQ